MSTSKPAIVKWSVRLLLALLILALLAAISVGTWSVLGKRGQRGLAAPGAEEAVLAEDAEEAALAEDTEEVILVEDAGEAVLAEDAEEVVLVEDAADALLVAVAEEDVLVEDAEEPILIEDAEGAVLVEDTELVVVVEDAEEVVLVEDTELAVVVEDAEEVVLVEDTEEAVFDEGEVEAAFVDDGEEEFWAAAAGEPAMAADGRRIRIRFRKIVEGGEAKPRDWSFKVDGKTVDHRGVLQLEKGKYKVAETGGKVNDLLYELTDASGACELNKKDAIVLNVRKGSERICEITNTRLTGELAVTKYVDDGSEWKIKVHGPTKDNAVLQDGDTLGPIVADTGVYSITERFADNGGGRGYYSTGFCTGSSVDNGALTAKRRAIADLVIAEDDDVECSFTNSKESGTIKIVKKTKPDGDKTVFGFNTNTYPASFPLSDGESQKLTDLPAGATYVISETVPPGWRVRSITCKTSEERGDHVQVYADHVVIELQPDEKITCTFVDGPAMLAVTKEADPETLLEPGGKVQYKVTVDNLSKKDSMLLTKLTDSLYGDLTDPGNTDIRRSTCELVTIQPQSTYRCRFRVKVTGVAGDVIPDTVRVVAMDESEDKHWASADAEVRIVAEPPDTGVGMAIPTVMGGLATLGLALAGAGTWVRRRTRR